MYDPRLGRWRSVDPHTSDYPAISPYVFVNNMPLIAIDPDGKDIVIVVASGMVGGLGHMAILIGNDETGWTYYSKDGVRGGGGKSISGPSNPTTRGFDNLALFKEWNMDRSENRRYTSGFKITSSADTDQRMKEAAEEQLNQDYNFFTANCADVAIDALKTGEFDPGYVEVTRYFDSYSMDGSALPSIPVTTTEIPLVPVDMYDAVVRNNSKLGTDVDIYDSPLELAAQGAAEIIYDSKEGIVNIVEGLSDMFGTLKESVQQGVQPFINAFDQGDNSKKESSDN